MPEAGRFEGDDDAFAALVLRSLDGLTSPEEEALLNAELGDPAATARREVFVDLCRQRGRLLEAPPKAQAARRPAPASRGIGRRLLAVAAALLVAAITGLLLLPARAPEAVARLAEAEGRVFRTDGSARVPAEPGTPFSIGQGLETEGRSRAVLAFDDGTRVELGANTTARGLDLRGGKKLVLARGSLAADVVRQPPGAPMSLRTPEGEARVLGTRLRLSAAPGTTRLEVERGLVRLTRLSDGKSADVASGQFAVASAGPAPAARSAALARIAAMPSGTWQAIPNSRMSQVFPDASTRESIQGRMGPDAVVAAWSGGAWDGRRNRLVVWGGGYSDYHGNELYAFSLETLAWERLTEPQRSPALNRDGNADGTPNARATYNGLAYLAPADRLFALGGAVAGNGFAVCTRPWLYDFSAKAWSRRSPGGENPEAGMGAVCAYDPGGRKVWWGDGSGLYSYDVDGDRWTRHAADKFYYQTAAIDRKRNLWVAVGSGEVAAYDLSRPVRQAWATRGGDAVVRRPNPGLDYDLVRDRLTAWAGGAVHTLDPETRVWTAKEAPGAPAPTPNGIFGRWRYVPDADVFLLVTSAGEDVHLYKP
jgi:ferric-dicitrate binding protein FerR (iron transport regulator)